MSEDHTPPMNILPPNWSQQKAFAGKSFDDLFNIEGISLSWFYQRLLLPHILPKPVNAYSHFFQKKKIHFFQQMQFAALAKLLPKYLLYTEMKVIQSNNKKKNATQKISTIVGKDRPLILSYVDHLQSGKIHRIQEIIDALRQKKSEPYLLFVDKLPSRKKRQNEVNGLYKHVDAKLIGEARKEALQLYQRWKVIDKEAMEKILSMNHESLWSYVKYAFSAYMSQEFLFLTCLFYLAFKKIIREENIKIVVVTAQNGLFERCCLAAAKSENIPSLFIQHGIAVTTQPAAELFLENTFLAVFGPHTKKALIRAGIPSEKIISTGPVVYDAIAKYVKKRTRGQNLLIITQPLVEDHFIGKQEYFQKLEQVINACLPLETKIIIKLHPRETQIKEYKKIVQLSPEKIQLKKHENADRLYSLLSQAKVMINFRITGTILEASILEVPVITIPFVKEMPAYLKGVDPSLWIPLSENMESRIKAVWEHPEHTRLLQKKTVKKILGTIDGKSSERAATVILELMREKEEKENLQNSL